MHDLIWALVGLSIEDGRVLTEKQDAVRLIGILYVLGERYLPEHQSRGDVPNFREQFLQVLDKIEHLRRDRNFILHGSWGKLDGIPGALSLREKSKNASELIFETFPHERLRDIANNIEGCTKFLLLIVGIVEASRGKPKPRPPISSPT
jgi:hypothetical protein